MPSHRSTRSLSLHSLALSLLSPISPRSPLLPSSPASPFLPSSPASRFLPVVASFLPRRYLVFSHGERQKSSTPRSKTDFLAPATSFWVAEALGLRAPTLDPRAPTTMTKRRWMWSSVAAAERNAAEPQDPGVLLGPSPFWCSCWVAGDLSKPTPSHAKEQPMVNPTPTPSHGAAATQGQTTTAAAVNFQILAEGMDGRRKTTRGYRFKKFSLEDRNGGNGDPEAIEISVHDYFVNYHAAGLTYSSDLPCINVGKPKRPAYLPIELCQLPLQRYTKSLSTLQWSCLVEKLRQKPQERMSVLSEVVGFSLTRHLSQWGCAVSLANGVVHFSSPI